MSERKTVTVSVVSQGQYEGGPFDFGGEYEEGSLNRVINSLTAIRDSIPPEYRDKATCCFDAGTFYDSITLDIDVAYSRPETDEEMADRINCERQHEENRKMRERAEYARLKAKYG